MVKNGPKWSKVDPHSPQIIQNGPNGQNIYFFNRLKMVKSVSKLFKMVKFVKMVYYGTILSKTVENGPERF